jgi:hypothetical protein
MYSTDTLDCQASISVECPDKKTPNLLRTINTRADATIHHIPPIIESLGFVKRVGTEVFRNGLWKGRDGTDDGVRVSGSSPRVCNCIIKGGLSRCDSHIASENATADTGHI